MAVWFLWVLLGYQFMGDGATRKLSPLTKNRYIFGVVICLLMVGALLVNRFLQSRSTIFNPHQLQISNSREPTSGERGFFSSSTVNQDKFRSRILPAQQWKLKEIPRFVRCPLMGFQVSDISNDRKLLLSKGSNRSGNRQFWTAMIGSDYKLKDIVPLPPCKQNTRYSMTVRGEVISMALPEYRGSIDQSRSAMTIHQLNPFSYQGEIGSLLPYNHLFPDGREVKSMLVDGNSVNHEPQGYAICLSTTGKPEELIRGLQPLDVRNIQHNGTIWVLEGEISPKGQPQNLIMIPPSLKSGITRISLPKNVGLVSTVVGYGDEVTVTAGLVTSKIPNRAFTTNVKAWKDGKVGLWTELPLDDEYDFATARCMIAGGWIFGNCENVSGTKQASVLWKGSNIFDLANLPEWPKYGLKSLVVSWNQRGDLYVRNVFNLPTGDSDFYLLVRK